jgi:hypothetical protein
MKLNLWLRLVAVAVFSAVAVDAADVKVTGDTTVLIDPGEPLAIRKAASDLVSDLSKVFGRQARMVHDLDSASPVTICIAFEHNLPPRLTCPTGTEAMEIRVVRDPWPKHKVRHAIVLTGSEPRGVVYAVYHFSQQFLGVDPMYFWTDHDPARRASVTMPDSVAISEKPVFRYRGWFINDEDLLTGWKPGAADNTGIALATWDKVFETLLRLKGNMIVPGTFIFPDEPQVAAAGARGLIISQHHVEVLGTNTYRWPDDQPYSFTARPDLITSAWAKAVEGYPAGQEVIWTLGYRGRHDRAFWRDDKSAGESDEEHAAVLQRAIAKQIEIVTAHRDHPYFLMNAWQEAVPLLRKGVLRLPPGVTLVWPDNGSGFIQDNDSIAKGNGVYYHTAMYNSRANQLTEMVPLDRIQRELGRAAKAGATEYLLVNTSDVRPVPMTTRAVMELAWNPAPWIAGQGDRDYLRRWSAEEFGPRARDALEAYYQAYFQAPGRYGQAEEQTFGDNAYFSFARGFLWRALTGGRLSYASWLERITKGAREAEPRWDHARELAEKAEPLIPTGRALFFQAHVRTQLDIHHYGNRMLIDVLDAVSAPAVATRRASIAAAIVSIEAVQRSLHSAEYGQWAGFYRGDLMVAVHHALALARGYQLKLDGKPLPADLVLEQLPEDPYVRIKAYQGDRRVPLGPSQR